MVVTRSEIIEGVLFRRANEREVYVNEALVIDDIDYVTIEQGDYVSCPPITVKIVDAHLRMISLLRWPRRELLR